ncbi:MAG: BatD family protein [Planctomycetia bacterium]|nr:BatD family protein [Planctomycetia bacterium]
MTPRRPALLRLGLALGLGLALATCPAGRPAHADDPATPRAFVEVVAPRPVVYVGEVVPLRVRVGVDAAWVPDRLVPLVRQRLDLPLHVEAPSLRERPGLAVVSSPTAPGTSGPTLALNDAPVPVTRAADEVRDGVRCAVFEVERRVVADAAGPLTAAPPTLRFAAATRFHDDLLHGRVPVDRRDVAVSGPALALDVRDLPVEGRPDGFGGAIGRFTATASTDATAIDVGRAFRVTWTVRGPGNLARVPGLRVPALDGFHVYGSLESATDDTRTAIVEVAATRADVAAFPALVFAYFDPEPPAGYRVASTAPLPLTVRGAEGARDREARSPSAVPAWAWAAAAAAAVVAFVVGRRRAARRTEAADPVHVAIAAFRAAPAEGGLEAFLAVLAAHLGTNPWSVIGPGLAARLGARGVAPDAADRVAALVEAWQGARYGGDAPRDLEARVDAAVAAIEAARASRSRR